MLIGRETEGSRVVRWIIGKLGLATSSEKSATDNPFHGVGNLAIDGRQRSQN